MTLRFFRPAIGVMVVGALLLMPAPALAQSQIGREGRASINGVRLHYEVRGAGPVVVFLHAGLADSRMWDDQVRYFSGRYTTVRLDARGYGQSEPATTPYSPVDDVYRLLRFLKVERATMVGASLGGTEAIDFTAAHPDMVAALVVVAGSPGWESYSETLNQRTAAYLEAGARQGPAALVRGWLRDPMLAAAAKQPRIRARVETLLRDNAAGLLATPLLRPLNIPTPSLASFEVPTLVVVGDQDDPEIVERSRSMAVRIAGAHLALVRGAGHLVNVERPAAFNRTLGEFLTLAADR